MIVLQNEDGESRPVSEWFEETVRLRCTDPDAPFVIVISRRSPATDRDLAVISEVTGFDFLRLPMIH